MKKVLFLLFSFSFIATSCKIDDDAFMLPCESNVICLETDKTTLPADGTSTILLTATIPRDADLSKRNITFESATGGFKSETNQSTPVKKVNQDGISKTLLTVGNVPGEYIVSAKVSDGTNTYIAEEIITLEPLQYSVDEVITVSLNHTSDIIANNQQLVNVNIKINHINLIAKQIKVRVEGGWSFIDRIESESDFSLSNLGEASFILLVGQQPGNGILSVTIDNLTKTNLYSILPAYPETLTLITSQEGIIERTNGSTVLEVFLNRTTGKVSEGVIVNYVAVQNQGGVEVVVGSFNPPFSKTTSEEKVTFNFRTPADTSSINKSEIKIRAFVEEPNNDIIIKDSLSIKVIESE